jgi:hypothetical protein
LRGGLLNDAYGANIESHLVASTAPGAVKKLASSKTRGGGRVVAEANVVEPSVVSLESMIGVNNVAAARTRMGVSNVPTLDAIGNGSCAVSMPMMMSSAMPLTADTTSPIHYMLGSLALEQPTQIGFAWESYGFKRGDTINVAISVTRQTEIGALRSIGMRLGIAGDPRRPITIAWKEPSASNAVLVYSPSSTTIMRKLMLDLSRLGAGNYSVSVTMEGKTCKATSELREFSVWL